MNRIYFLTLVAVILFPAAALAQIEIGPEYGSLATAPDTIVFTNNASPGDFAVLDVAADSGFIATGVALEDTGAIGYITGTQWLFGMTSAAETSPGDVFVFDAGTATIGSPLANINDVRDLAVIDQGSRFDAIVSDRANDTVHLITDILGTPSTTEITPTSIAGNVGIQGLVALSDSLYFLYDELPEGGFGNDELIVVEGNTPDATTTRISWNDIGSAGAGLNPDELSVDFHNGLAVRQTDDSTIIMYLSNFGTFSENQIIEVTWTDSGNGFDFSTPSSQVLITEPDLFNAVADNNGTADDPIALMNSRGVAILPGETAADDRLVIWVDASEGGNTYMVIYDIADKTFSLFGGDALEMILDTTDVLDWPIR